MSIEAAITVTLAEVEVTDDYQVELRQHELSVSYSWDEAAQLANELITAIEDARRMLTDDPPNRNPEEWAKAGHGFDVDMPKAADS